MNATLSARLLRGYALTCCFFALALVPLFVVRLGRRAEAPARFDRGFAADGSLRLDAPTRPASGLVVVTSVSVDGGPAAPPSGVRFQRRARYLPPGTTLTLVGTDAAGRPATLTAPVLDLPARGPDVARDLVLQVLAFSLVLGGATLALAALERRTLFAAAFLAGLGLLASGYPFEATMTSIRDDDVRDAASLAITLVERFALFFGVAFVSEFPLDLSGRRLFRVARSLMLGACVLSTALFAAMHAGALADALSPAAQVVWVRIARRLDAFLYTLSALGTVILGLRQARAVARAGLSRDARRRASILGLSLVAGTGVPALASILQTTALLVTGGFLIPPLAMSLALLPLVLVPAAFVYASLSPRVESARLLARRALLFAFADRTVRVASLVPLGALAFLLWRNRERPLKDLFAVQGAVLVLSAIAALLLLRYADALRALVERAFYRERQDARRILSELAASARRATDDEGLVRELVEKVQEAFHPESVALLVRDTASGTLREIRGDAPPLDAGSALATLLAGAYEPLSLEPGVRAWESLREADREWLAARDARLLAPLFDSDGALLAVLVLGEKRSEMPYDREDVSLLSAVTASAALALENRLLRTTPSTGAPAPTGGPADERPHAARSCPRCLRLFPKTVGRKCPDDAAYLVDEPVPYLLSGKFRFERRLGSGGMGLVYQAYDLALGRTVAIKTLPRVSSEHAARLRREARAAASIQHPNIAVIHGAEQWEGTPLLVFEYVDGGTLARRIREGPIPPATVVSCGMAISSALVAAHGAGVLHRDIKPSNIGFTSAGVPKLLDFGLARLLHDPRRDAPSGVHDPPATDSETAEAPLTRSNVVVGTVAYVSPEAVHGDPPSAALDLWALAVTLYEALTGQNPFLELTQPDTMRAIVERPVPDVRVRRPDCPAALAKFLARALSKELPDRPRQADAFRIELASLAI